MRTLGDIVGVGACDACRGRITKCSIERPTCAECVRRGSECVYRERFSHGISPRAGPSGQQQRQNINFGLWAPPSSGSPARKHPRDLPEEDVADRSETSTQNTLSNYREAFKQYQGTESYKTYQTYLEGHKRRKYEHNPNRRSSDQHEVFNSMRLNMGDLSIASPSSPMAPSPIKIGMDEVRLVTTSLGVNLELIRLAAFPPENGITQAVEDFLNGTGALVFLWSQDQARDLIKSIYRHKSGSTATETAEVFAMSAVGSYCDGDHHTSMVQEQILHFFLHTFSTHGVKDDFEYMRMFSCLALCRFTNSVASARVLMQCALNIGRQKYSSQAFKAETSAETLRYWWKVFRSVLFLESWFAYNTNNESRVTHEDLTLFKPPNIQAQPEAGAVSDQVDELGQLAAYIALDLKSAGDERVVKAKTHLTALNEWHRTLPPPMQLSRLSLSNPLTTEWHTKRRLLQLHILFPGIFIEPHRSFLVQVGQNRLNDNNAMETEQQEMLDSIETQCNMAARQAARVASLLQVDSLVRAHCWVSVYTSYTGSSVLLFDATQKLWALSGENVGQDLAYASSHMNILSLCSNSNEVARTLYTTLQILFNDIREALVSPAYRGLLEKTPKITNIAHVPPEHLEAVQGSEEICRTILELMRRTIGILQDALVFRD